MPKYAKLINAKDNVATALVDCAAGDEIFVKFDGTETPYICKHDIPFGHKIALVDIAKGQHVIKYGESIGSAFQDIEKGDWVHIHNVKDDYKVLDKAGNPLAGQDD